MKKPQTQIQYKSSFPTATACFKIESEQFVKTRAELICFRWNRRKKEAWKEGHKSFYSSMLVAGPLPSRADAPPLPQVMTPSLIYLTSRVNVYAVTISWGEMASN